MANVTAADVKRLRDATGAGMMDCKKALEEADGDFDSAVEVLRIKGAAKAAKRADERTVSNGLVASVDGAMVELNCETDFVAKNDDVRKLADELAALARDSKATGSDELAAAKLPDGRTGAEAVEAVAAVIGEKLAIGGVAVFDGTTTSYLHRRDPQLPPQVGVLVEFAGDDEETARAVAMQIAAMRPQFVKREDVPSETVENERRIAEEIARNEGKPEPALPKIVEGRLNGFFKDAVLLEQPSVMDQSKTVARVLEEAGVTVSRFARFEATQA